MKARLFNLFKVLPLLLTLWMAAPAAVDAQCPMCKAAVESNAKNGKGSAIVENLNLGIVYLFVLPYSAIMLVATVWYLAYRKRKREDAAAKLLAGDVGVLDASGHMSSEQ